MSSTVPMTVIDEHERCRLLTSRLTPDPAGRRLQRRRTLHAHDCRYVALGWGLGRHIELDFYTPHWTIGCVSYGIGDKVDLPCAVSCRLCYASITYHSLSQAMAVSSDPFGVQLFQAGTDLQFKRDSTSPLETNRWVTG